MRRMEDGSWEMAFGNWQMVDSRWNLVGGIWEIGNSSWEMVDRIWGLVGGILEMVDGGLQRAKTVVISCVKNVYSIGITSVQLPTLCTPMLDTSLRSVQKSTTSPLLYTQFIPLIVHKHKRFLSPVSVSLYPLPTGPIISNHEVRKERI